MSAVTSKSRQVILHTALARLVSEPSPSAVHTWEVVCEVADGFDLGERSRHFRSQLRTYAEVYLSLFMPSAGFEFGGVIDEGLIWSGTQSAFFDFVFAGSRNSDPWALSVRPRVRRLVDAGQARFGGLFAGVRLLVPAAPTHSLRVTDRKAPPMPLAPSPWWFGPPLASVEKLLTPGGGS